MSFRRVLRTRHSELSVAELSVLGIGELRVAEFSVLVVGELSVAEFSVLGIGELGEHADNPESANGVSTPIKADATTVN